MIKGNFFELPEFVHASVSIFGLVLDSLLNLRFLKFLTLSSSGFYTLQQKIDQSIHSF